MELKEYQSTALDTFTLWLDKLNAARTESDKAVAALEGAGVDVPSEVRNYPKKAWEKLRESGGRGGERGRVCGQVRRSGTTDTKCMFQSADRGRKDASSGRGAGAYESADGLDVVDYAD